MVRRNWGVRLTGGSANPRLAGSSLRRRFESEFDTSDHLMPEDRMSKKAKKTKNSAHMLRLSGVDKGWVLACNCGWRSGPSKRGGQLLAAAKQYNLSNRPILRGVD